MFSTEESSLAQPARRPGPEPLLASLRGDRQPRGPTGSENSYPYAYEHIAQVFDHPCAPDLCVLHTSSHRCEDHRGEHGSLGVIQARAPFVISGAGVHHARPRGPSLPARGRGPDRSRTARSRSGRGRRPERFAEDDAYLSRQDGDVVEALFDPAAMRPRG